MKEKEELKASYFKELEKFDWKQWENKLKIAYNNINWDKVNNELNMAINQIRTDSLHRVYNEASVKLDKVQRQLLENQLKGIPDSDISIETIEEKKQIIRQTIDELKAFEKENSKTIIPQLYCYQHLGHCSLYLLPIIKPTMISWVPLLTVFNAVVVKS